MKTPSFALILASLIAPLAGCSASPDGADDSSVRVVTSDDLAILPAGEAITADASQPGKSVQFDETRGAIEWARVRIVTVDEGTLAMSEWLARFKESTGNDLSSKSFAVSTGEVKVDGEAIVSSGSVKPEELAGPGPSPTGCCLWERNCGHWECVQLCQ
jgi:hypothetical protein